MSDGATLEALGERHPEWKPWLGVVREVVAAFDGSDWTGAVPQAPAAREAHAPMLAGATVVLDAGAAETFYARLASAAAAAPAFSTLSAESAAAGAVFSAGLDLDESTLRSLAETANVELHAFSALAALLPTPFLHACQRAWDGAKPRDWAQGYCPVCGSWPALAEICGVERARYLRCGRCGSGWRSSVLSCAYCGTRDHDQLRSLVPDGTRANASIEVCNACHGYLKAFTKLRPTAPQSVMLDDLASVELDVVAAQQGYRRPPGAGYAPRVKLAPSQAGASAR